jgi:hypothetical protein
MGEIADRHLRAADARAQQAHFLMRQLQELSEKPELVHKLESRRVDRIAAEIAEKIRVFFHHDDLDACAREQESEHHPGRSTADDAAGRIQPLAHSRNLSPEQQGIADQAQFGVTFNQLSGFRDEPAETMPVIICAPTDAELKPRSSAGGWLDHPLGHHITGEQR